MNILILGAGQVGASLAEALVSEANDITLVDLDAVPLAQLADRLDVRTVTGNAAFPSVLREAGIESADLLVAVTRPLGQPPPPADRDLLAQTCRADSANRC